MTVDAVAFWSYVRDDDTAEDGRIGRLADQLRSEYELITGEKLSVFVDREGIEWGDQWRARIDQALAGTTFFIPIVTPRFFNSSECRRELLTFAGTARSLDLEELILPIYYASVAALESGEALRDEAMSLIAARQWEDWRDARLEDHASSMFRRSVNKLATRLALVAARVRDRPDVGPRFPSGVVTQEVEERGEPPGVVDLLAKGEEALPKLGPLMASSGEIVKSIGSLMERATRRIEESDSRGKGYAGRLTVSRQLAEELEDPASQLERLGEEFASLLVDIDPAILTIVRLVEADPNQYETSSEIRELFGSIKEMVGAAREAAISTEELVAQLESTTTLSRDLRKPVRRMQAGLRGFLDGRAVFEEWGKLIEKFETERSRDADEA